MVLETTGSSTRGSGLAPSWPVSRKRRASKSYQARPEEAREPTSGGTWTMLLDLAEALQLGRLTHELGRHDGARRDGAVRRHGAHLQ